MSAISYGLSQGYIEEEVIDNNAWESYRINPRKILFESTLHAIIVELSELGFDITFDKKYKVYYANNKNKVMREQNEKATEKLNAKDIVDDCCEKCFVYYETLKNEFIGAACAIAEINHLDTKEVAGFLAVKLHNELSKFVDEGKERELLRFYEASNELVKNFDEFIRGEKNE